MKRALVVAAAAVLGSPTINSVDAIPVMRRYPTADPIRPKCVWEDDPFEDLQGSTLAQTPYD